MAAPQYVDLGDDNSTTISIGNYSPSKTKVKGIKESNDPILCFNTYFEEKVDGKNELQIRVCNLYFYTEDGSIKIVEKPVLNAGVTQGTLVRRAVILKNDGTSICEDDIMVGCRLQIYGRYFRYVLHHHQIILFLILIR